MSGSSMSRMTLPKRDELRAVAEAEVLSDAAARRVLERRTDLRVARARHDRARHNHDVVVVALGEPSPDLLDRREDVLVRERSSLVGRGRNEQDGYLRIGRCREIRRGAEPLVRRRHEILEPRLLDRCASLVQRAVPPPG